MAAAQPVNALLLYYVQNDKGESPAHPNACRLRRTNPDRVTLRDVLDVFPLRGQGVFHFRFQTTFPDKQVVFLDVVNPDDSVPLVGNNVIARVLRLDSARCAITSTDGLALRPRSTQSKTVSPRVPAAAAPAAPAAQAQPATTGAIRRPTPAAAAPAPVAAAAVSATSDVPRPAAAQRASSPGTGGAGGTPKATATAVPPARGSAPAAVVTPVVPAVPSAPLPSVVVPDVVDADLEGKSDYVKAMVMERRNKLKATQEERIAEAAAREADLHREQAEKEEAKGVYGAKLKEWSEEIGGAKKNIRVLISTMHTILWEDSKWEPMPMAKLIDPKRVRLAFLKAVTIVHPDKHNTMDSHKKFIASHIFHCLETAWRDFQEKEM